MTRRSRARWKALLLALTIVAVATLPALSLPAFLYLVGAVFAVIGLFCLGMFFDLVQLYVEFRGFKDRIEQQSRRTFGWRR